MPLTHQGEEQKILPGAAVRQSGLCLHIVLNRMYYDSSAVSDGQNMLPFSGPRMPSPALPSEAEYMQWKMLSLWLGKGIA